MKCFWSGGPRPEAPVEWPGAARPETVSPNFNRQSLISDNLVVGTGPSPQNERAILCAAHDRVESVRPEHTPARAANRGGRVDP